MARQSGIIKLKGTIDDISFYKSQDGHLARMKGGPTAEKVLNDPAFQRTRENNSEFARAGAAGRVLRTTFRNFLMNAADNRMVSRLTKDMIAVVKADATSVRGKRNVLDGELEMLEGFEFNINGKLSTTLHAQYAVTYDRVVGNIALDIPSLIPINMISAPAGATHVNIFFAGAEIDFENEVFNMVSAETGNLTLDESATAVNLPCNLTANSGKPVFIVAGISFSQSVNGVQYPLKNGFYNAMAIVEVSGL